MDMTCITSSDCVLSVYDSVVYVLNISQRYLSKCIRLNTGLVFFFINLLKRKKNERALTGKRDYFSKTQ